MKVLVTGVTGAIGADLAPRLIAAGHRVRGFARDPARVAVAGLDGVVRGDAVTGAGLGEALRGIDVAYFLIHSMEAAAHTDGGFAARDRLAAPAVAEAAAAAGGGGGGFPGGLGARGGWSASAVSCRATSAPRRISPAASRSRRRCSAPRRRASRCARRSS